MKLWRKTQDEAGNSHLTEVTDVRQIDAGKPVLFVLPTKRCTNDNPDGHRYAAGAVKAAQRMLGEEGATSPDTEVLVVTYDEKTGHGRRRYMNHALDAVQDRDADGFVRDFLKPLVERDARISLFGLSYGSVFSDAVRATYIREARNDGKPDAAIREDLADIYNIQIANISRATQPGAKGRDESFDYSGVFFSFANDITAKIDAGRLSASIPKAHGKDDVTIAQLPGNRCNVIVHAPKEMLRHEEDGGWSLMKNQSPLPPIRTNHMVDFFLLKDDPVGMYPLLERSLHNAVNREGRPAADTLLSHKPQKSYAPSTQEVMSLSERADQLYGSAQHLAEGWASRISRQRLTQQLSGREH